MKNTKASVQDVGRKGNANRKQKMAAEIKLIESKPNTSAIAVNVSYSTP